MAKTVDNNLRGLSMQELRDLGLVVEGVFDGAEVTLSDGHGRPTQKFSVQPVVLYDMEAHGPGAPAETMFKPVLVKVKR